MAEAEDVIDLMQDVEMPDFRNTSRAEFAYKKLLAAIREQILLPGDRIREDEIAKQLRISRTPLRQALHQLQTRGLLQHAPGRGLIVTELGRQQIIDLYATREVLEGAAARMAALRAGPADIASMRAVLAAFSKAAPDAGKLSRINHVFHATVHEAAHNSYLSETLNNFNDTLALLRGTTFTIKGRWRHELAENCEVVDAIERRDADAAEQAARGNIREALKVRLKVLLMN